MDIYEKKPKSKSPDGNKPKKNRGELTRMIAEL